MKKLLLLFTVALAGSAMPALAQFNYTLNTSNQAYTRITGGTSINGSDIWDDDYYGVQMPFTFKVDGASTNLFSLALFLPGFVSDTTNLADLNGFNISDADLADRGNLAGTSSLSPISYTVSGTAPNRIFKAQIANAGFYEEQDIYSTSDDSVDIQMWLYETSNIVELRYGPSKITHPSDYYNFGNGPVIGMFKHADFTQSGNNGSQYNLSGNATAPTIDSVDANTGNVNALNSWPPSGTVYRFTPKGNANLVHGVAALTSVSIYPTRTANTLFVNYTEAATASYTVMTADGRQVLNGTLASGKTSLDVQSLAAGMYLLKVSNATGTGAYRFVKQ